MIAVHFERLSDTAAGSSCQAFSGKLAFTFFPKAVYMCLFTLLLSQEIGWSVFLYCSSWSLLKSVEIVKIKDYNYFFSLFIVTPD